MALEEDKQPPRTRRKRKLRWGRLVCVIVLLVRRFLGRSMVL